MFRKSALALLALSLPLTASANWTFGLGYLNASDDIAGHDISLKGLAGSAGYDFSIADSGFSVEPMLRIATGLGHDRVETATIRLDRFAEVAIKAKFDVTENVELYVVPSYANAKLTAKADGQRATTEDWEFGYGAGVSYHVNEQFGLDLTYSDYDGVDVINAGFVFKF